jgi:membrane fusion protein (multidrug efflux system)
MPSETSGVVPPPVPLLAAEYDGRNTIPPAEEDQRASRRLGLRQTALLIVVVAVLIGGSIWLREWWLNGRFIETTDDAFVAADITTIASKVPGFVMKVTVTDNQRVRVGDLLAVIDDRDYRAELARAEANVAGQQATLENLDAATQLQAAVIEQTRAGVESTTVENQRAEADAKRARNLVKQNVVSKQDFDQVDASAAKARADDRAARAGALAAERQLAVIETQKKQVQAALAQTKAALELARLNLSSTEIRAPIDGVVGNRHARVGDYTTVGAQLMNLVPITGLYVDANFKESQVAHMRPGQSAVIVADVQRGVKIAGRVVSLSPATGAQFALLPAENATGNFTKIIQRLPIRIELEGQAAELGQLRPGLSVTARVDQR